jgi:uncharacterized protein
MKIHVNRIPPEGLREESSLDPKNLDMGRFDLHILEPILVSSLITKAENEIIVQSNITCIINMSCARCLEEFDKKIHVSTILNYRANPGDVIDITEDIRQEMILQYPMIPVCKDSCKGLCQSCGQNLNKNLCNHHKQE